MKDIEIDYLIADQVKKLQIQFTSQGTGQVMVDKYFHGQVVCAQGQWRVYLNSKSNLDNSEDIQTLIQILTEQGEK